MLAPEALPALVARMDGHVEETAAAALRTGAILDDLQGAIARAREAAESGTVRAGEGAMVLEGAAGTIRELARALAASASSGRAIAEVAQQQEVGLETLRHAMNDIFLAQERMRGVDARGGGGGTRAVRSGGPDAAGGPSDP